MNDDPVCLYCFADRDTLPGIGSDLEALTLEGVTAVIGRIPSDDLADRPEPDQARLLTRACRHQQIIAGVMADAAVLPVRLGAVFSSREALKELLRRRRDEISRFLDEVSGKEEWAVRAYLEPSRAGDWLAGADLTLAERRRQLPASPGARYFQEKRWHADLQKHVGLWAKGVVEELDQGLRALAADARPLKLRGRDDAGKEMVFHRAYLLPCEAVADFRAGVEAEHEERVAQGLSLEYSGPWPPYSFCPSLEGDDP